MTPEAPAYRLWHPSGNRRPQPVLVVQVLRQKVRVVDMNASTLRSLRLREVFPENLTEWKEAPDAR